MLWFFYIATECSALLQRGETQILIVCDYKGFQSVVDYSSVRPWGEKVRMVVAASIDQGLISLTAKEDHERRKRIKESMQQLDLGVEYARLEERSLFRNAIIETFEGTKYEERLSEILAYIEENREKTGRPYIRLPCINLAG